MRSWTLIERRLASVLAQQHDDRTLPEFSENDIRQLADAALQARVPGLLLRALRVSSDVPDDVAEQLRCAAGRTAATNLAAEAEVLRLVTVFQEHDIPVLFLKGMALMFMVYERPDLRHMTDVDLLIQPRDADRADAVLRHAGCAPGATPLNEHFYPQYYYEREYLSPRGRRLDVHVRPLRPLRYARTMPEDALWCDPASVHRGDAIVRVPGPREMLLHLAAHSTVHGHARLVWLYDIVAFAHAFPQAVDGLAGQASEWGVALAVKRGLQAAADLFEDERLAAVARSVEGRGRWSEAVVLRQAPRDGHRPLAHLLTNLATTPGARFKLGYLKAVLVPGDAHLGEVYSGRHAGWRWCAHARRVGRALIKPLRAGPAPNA
jgi:hypothetical protein